MGFVPVGVDGVDGVFVEGEEAGFIALEMGGHEGFFVADGKMHQTALEGKQWFTIGATVFPVLLDGLFDHLPCEGVFEFGGDDRQTVDEKDDIDGVFVLLAVFELADDAEAVGLIEPMVLGVHPAGGLEVGELKFFAPVFEACAQDVQSAVFLHLF